MAGAQGSPLVQVDAQADAQCGDHGLLGSNRRAAIHPSWMSRDAIAQARLSVIHIEAEKMPGR